MKVKNVSPEKEKMMMWIGKKDTENFKNVKSYKILIYLILYLGPLPWFVIWFCFPSNIGSIYLYVALFIRTSVYPTHSQCLTSVFILLLDDSERKLRIPGKNPKSLCSNKLPYILFMKKGLTFWIIIEIFQGNISKSGE